MKISEMTNDQAATAILRICGPFERISDDEEVMGLFDELKKMKKGTIREGIMKMIPKFVTLALKKHKLDLYEVIGALMMKPVHAVATMNFKETIDAVSDSIDDVLTSFFPQSANVTRNSGGRSSAASPDTAGTGSTP